MKNILILSSLLLALAAPAYAMTEESNHYQGTDQRANATDDDDALEQFGNAPSTNYLGQSGREQQLLEGDTGSTSGQTYGFGGYSNSWTQSRSNFGSSGSGFYYGMH